MTTGFETQQTTFGAIVRTAPKPQIVGSKLASLRPSPEERPAEPRTFAKTPDPGTR